MAIINLPFSNEINSMLQVGDTVYYCTTTSSGGFSVESSINNLTKLGECHSINNTTNVIQVDTGNLSVALPTSGDFILFSKDNSTNLSFLTGYYAEVKFVNNSKIEAELFSIGSEIFESSK